MKSEKTDQELLREWASNAYLMNVVESFFRKELQEYTIFGVTCALIWNTQAKEVYFQYWSTCTETGLYGRVAAFTEFPFRDLMYKPTAAPNLEYDKDKACLVHHFWAQPVFAATVEVWSQVEAIEAQRVAGTKFEQFNFQTDQLNCDPRDRPPFNPAVGTPEFPDHQEGAYVPPALL